MRGEFHLQGIRNHDLGKALNPPAPNHPGERHRAAARTTRQLRWLCAHQLIYRVGRTHYYRPTQQGQEVMNTAL